ncbi:hypothetical protein GCM10009739_17580 [Microbacterium ulmi]
MPAGSTNAYLENRASRMRRPDEDEAPGREERASGGDVTGRSADVLPVIGASSSLTSTQWVEATTKAFGAVSWPVIASWSAS